MDGSQPHEILSFAVNALTCAFLVRSLTTCALQHEVMRTSNLVAGTRLWIHGRTDVNQSVFTAGNFVIAFTSGRTWAVASLPSREPTTSRPKCTAASSTNCRVCRVELLRVEMGVLSGYIDGESTLSAVCAAPVSSWIGNELGALI